MFSVGLWSLPLSGGLDAQPPPLTSHPHAHLLALAALACNKDLLPCPLASPFPFFWAWLPGLQLPRTLPLHVVGPGFSGTSRCLTTGWKVPNVGGSREPSGPASATVLHRLLPLDVRLGSKSEPVTYVDVFQIQEVQGEPVALPDDGWSQVSTHSTRQHGAHPHGHCGHTDPLLGGEAELNHLCREKKAVRCRGFPAGQGPRLLEGNGNLSTTCRRNVQTDISPGRGATTYAK